MTSLILVFTLFLAGISQGSPSPKYVIELYVVVDTGVVSDKVNQYGYKKDQAKSVISMDIQFMVLQVNILFRSLSKYGLHIEIRLKKLNILEKELFPKCKRKKNGKLQINFALETFHDFIKKTKANYRKSGYDIALLYTGFELYHFQKERNKLYIFNDQICRRFSTIVQEYSGVQTDFHNTAKIIAKLLKVPEDDPKKCGSGYLMGNNEISENNWSFSNCTADAITRTLSRLKLKHNCFLETKAGKSTFNISTMAGADILDPEKTCQRAYRKQEAYFCSFEKYYDGKRPHGDAVCKRIYCSEKYDNGTKCYPLMSPEYMVCDPGKRCQQGKCIDAPKELPAPASVTRSDCVFGDVKRGKFRNMKGDCYHYNQGSLSRTHCDDRDMFEVCCDYCNKQKSTGEVTDECDFYDYDTME